MKDIIDFDCCSSSNSIKPISIITTENSTTSSLFDLFIKNDNNDHLLCEIIQNLWTLQDNTEEKDNNNNRDDNTSTDIFEHNCYYCNNNNDELQAYLYEIDMNLEYFRNDYQEFNHDNDYNCEDINIDKLLSFKFSHEACNMLIHEMETSDKLQRKQHNHQQTAADLYVDLGTIQEFVPGGGLATESCFESGVEDDFLFNDEQCGDIFENVYNYTPEDSTLIYDDTLIGDENLLDDAVSGTGSNAHLNRQLLSAAFYLRKKIMDLDAGGSTTTSSSTASSVKDGGSGSGGGSLIPRLLKSTFRKPCVYMLSEGRCSRSDCRFAHDLHNITCKYWLEGECLKGDSCEFLHDFAPESAYETSSASSFKSSSESIKSAAAAAREKQKQKDFNLNTMDFPVLGVAPATAAAAPTPAPAVPISTPTLAKVTTPEIEITDTEKIDEPQQQQQPSTKQLGTSSSSNSSSSGGKKSRKFKDNVLYSLSLPGLQFSNRKKNIN